MWDMCSHYIRDIYYNDVLICYMNVENIIYIIYNIDIFQLVMSQPSFLTITCNYVDFKIYFIIAVVFATAIKHHYSYDLSYCFLWQHFISTI